MTASVYGDKKYFLRMQKFVIRMNGYFWPGSDNTKDWQLVLAVLSPVEALCFVVFQVWFCLANISDIVEFLRGFSPMVVHALVAMKLLSIVWNRKDLKKILDFLYASFLNGN